MPDVNSFESAMVQLTEMICGNDDRDPAETLRKIASEIGVLHIAYSRSSSNKSSEINQLAAVATYSKEWQRRYLQKNYAARDPVITYGRTAKRPFDWVDLPPPDPAAIAFFADALNHGVGRNGFSIPLCDRRGNFALVSFTSDLSKAEWDYYKAANMKKLKLICVLIESVCNIDFKLRASPVHLSLREKQCLLWAARGSTFQQIADILGLASGTVKTHLDAARHKLDCTNLPQAAAIAFATGAIPEHALQLP
jgi:LuxR family transcriptional regulator, quorum-sensing system regulator CinR